ncbi:MAG: hypothetical protein O3A46_14245 [Candidatus Poribacteria bacterium]|nr:hypothetical protein [Candidatus Poribacteria bacterium]
MSAELREALREMVERLSDSELEAAARFLEYLEWRGEHPAKRAMREAPIVEPEPDEIERLKEFDRRVAAGENKWISHEEVKRRLLGDDN